ncbi:MAG: polysaccharide deacetylase family protein [Blautia sp.]|nr:polysaccharide deacetylase family protein [Blautia sp.]
MKRLRLISFVLISVLLFCLFLKNDEIRTSAAYTTAGRGMISLTLQAMEKNSENPRVALTFDDGPSKKYTPLLLKGLKARNIHASFFLMGKNIEENKDIVKQMHDDGHLIGNHTYDHVLLNKIPAEKAREEIEKTNNIIFEITGVYPSYIRPPFGAWRNNMELSVTMFPVFWDVDTLDWKSRNVNSILDIVRNHVHDGSIILMHDEYGTSVEAALKIIDLLTEKGYDFVTVDQLLVL